MDAGVSDSRRSTLVLLYFENKFEPDFIINDFQTLLFFKLA